MLNIDINRVRHPSVATGQLLTTGRIIRHVVGLTEKNYLCRNMFVTLIEEAQDVNKFSN
jgi:hypothetical protein